MCILRGGGGGIGGVSGRCVCWGGGSTKKPQNDQLNDCCQKQGEKTKSVHSS